jgi:hypothetical protein
MPKFKYLRAALVGAVFVFDIFQRRQSARDGIASRANAATESESASPEPSSTRTFYSVRADCAGAPRRSVVVTSNASICRPRVARMDASGLNAMWRKSTERSAGNEQQQMRARHNRRQALRKIWKSGALR